MMRAWVRRTLELHRELADVAEVDRWWWALAGGVAIAERWARPEVYLACDAEPDSDTLMGYRVQPPRGLVSDAIARARAARTALRELDGMLPDQPLAVTIRRGQGAATQPSDLDVAVFAVGKHCLAARLDDPTLATQLAMLIAGGEPAPWRGATPFVCVSIGDEPLETARHGHRRCWTADGGPWLGLGRVGDLAVVSTCHLVVDGYGHARLAARISELVPRASGSMIDLDTPPLVVAGGAVSLAIAWRQLACPTPRAIPLAYALGRILHRNAGRRDARFSPTIQIPVARGDRNDPARLHRRVVAAMTSIRFQHGEPEPFEVFEARVRGVIAREAAAHGLVSRLLAAARATPVPLSWKRKSISAKRPRWLESLAEVIGGRALLSRIAMDVPIPPMCAASSPSMIGTPEDLVGGYVITLLDDGTHGAISVCGSSFTGRAPSDLLDELLALVETPALRAGLAETARTPQR